MNKKKVIATASLVTSLIASGCSTNTQEYTKEQEINMYQSNDNIIEMEALKDIYYDTNFNSTKDIIDALENTNSSILHISSMYVSKDGGEVEVPNYYGECIMDYQEGDEIPFGCYLNQDGKLVKNCAATPLVTEEGIVYVVPNGYTLKCEMVKEYSISYEEFLEYDLSEVDTLDEVNHDTKSQFSIN